MYEIEAQDRHNPYVIEGKLQVVLDQVEALRRCEIEQTAKASDRCRALIRKILSEVHWFAVMSGVGSDHLTPPK